jgi:hypothetical protein
MHFVREESVSLDRTGVVLCDAHEGDNGSKRLFFRSEYWVPNANVTKSSIAGAHERAQSRIERSKREVGDSGGAWANRYAEMACELEPANRLGA